jgi:methylated-DNA-[protein]-cysteine S-methyltransferase
MPPSDASGTSVVYTLVPAPWGPIHLAATDRALVALEVFSPTDSFLARLERRLGRTARPTGDATGNGFLHDAAQALRGYLDGSLRSLDFPVDLNGLSEWDRRVLGVVRSIPYGQVSSYGGVARLAGSPGAARAVGSAVGRNPIGLLIPCHRVIAGNGSLGGYGGEWAGDRVRLLEIKEVLLTREGVSLPPATLFGT